MMERILQSRHFHLMFSLFLALLVLLIYSNTFYASFHFDDAMHIVENYLIRDLSNFFEILRTQRGVTMLTFALNYAVGGLNVFGYHLVNTAIHIVNGILVYLLLYYTIKRFETVEEWWAKKVAAFTALLFAVHPVQTQAVTYIVQRMESLSSMFYLLGLLCFVKAVDSKASTKRALLYGGVVLFYILGFYSKEIAVTLPAIVFLYDLYFINRGNVKGVFQRLPLYGVLSLLLIYFVVSTVVPAGGFGDLSKEAQALSYRDPSAGFGVKSITPLEYLYTQFNVLIYYIVLLLVPVNQNLDYDFPISRGLFETPVVKEGTVLNIPIPPPVVSLVILLVIIGIGLYLFLKGRSDGSLRKLMASFFIFWFFIILSPTSSFVPIIDVIFEHRVYLASVGFFAIFVLCIDGIFGYMAQKKEHKGIE